MNWAKAALKKKTRGYWLDMRQPWCTCNSEGHELQQKRSSQQLREGILRLLCTAGHCIHQWGCYTRGTGTCKRESRGESMRMLRGLEHLCYVDRLREVGLFSLEKRRLWGDFTAAFQYLEWAYKKHGERLFIRACRDRTSSSGFKMKEGRLNIRKKFSAVRAVRARNRLPREQWVPHPWRSPRSGCMGPWTA